MRDSRPVAIHPSSILFQLSQVPHWVVYNDCVLTSEEFMRDVSVINPLWLSELAPHYYMVDDPNKRGKQPKGKQGRLKQGPRRGTKRKGAPASASYGALDDGSMAQRLRSIF